MFRLVDDDVGDSKEDTSSHKQSCADEGLPTDRTTDDDYDDEAHPLHAVLVSEGEK